MDRYTGFAYHQLVEGLLRSIRPQAGGPAGHKDPSNPVDVKDVGEETTGAAQNPAANVTNAS
jgi:hypothetical protein